jgi:hypothetical protein
VIALTEKLPGGNDYKWPVVAGFGFSGKMPARRKDVGDHIDRGLILRRLLEEAGFLLIEAEK